MMLLSNSKRSVFFQTPCRLKKLFEILIKMNIVDPCISFYQNNYSINIYSLYHYQIQKYALKKDKQLKYVCNLCKMLI